MTQPPKDGTMIKARFKNYPTPLAACWNGAENEWAAAPRTWNDWYFETEFFQDEDLESWEEF